MLQPKAFYGILQHAFKDNLSTMQNWLLNSLLQLIYSNRMVKYYNFKAFQNAT